MKYLLLLLLVSPAAVSARCLPVTGDRILGADLASADTKFAALPADLQLGYAPMQSTLRQFVPGPTTKCTGRSTSSNSKEGTS